MKSNKKAVIKIENITKHYEMGTEVIKALNGVSLNIFENEYVALMGPSGSGKSTLMNILGCLDTPTDGNYFLDGENVATLVDNELAEIRNRKIGFVFQTFNLLPRLTATDNVALPLIYSGIGRNDRLVNAPSIILADEPTGNLDTKTSYEIMEILDGIQKDGNTVILVTHEEDIAQHAKRIIRLRDGKVESDKKN